MVIRVEGLEASTRTLVVLVVGSVAPFRHTLCRHLTGCGFAALDAGSADEAIALIEKSETLDLVFRDMRRFDESDGPRLTKWILENRPGLQEILESGDLGECNLVTPYALDQLVEKIRRRIQGPLSPGRELAGMPSR